VNALVLRVFSTPQMYVRGIILPHLETPTADCHLGQRRRGFEARTLRREWLKAPPEEHTAKLQESPLRGKSGFHATKWHWKLAKTKFKRGPPLLR